MAKNKNTDATNTSNKPGEGEDKDHSHGKAPNGTYYSNNDWDYLKGNGYSDEQIKANLDSQSKYKDAPKTDEEQAKEDEENKKKSQELAKQIKEANGNIELGEHPGWIDTAAILKNIPGIDAYSFLGNSASIKARQHLLNPKKYKDELKTPNPNKMPQNEDPYPVDLKIEEFEVHKPDVKAYEVTVPNSCEELAKLFLKSSDHTEKRLIKLENQFCTLMRMFFRLGSRVPINCVYYGGQNPSQKYKNIRCMQDDRITDGQYVQIDQCLCCTRFEPVDGQMYECLNDIGANVATILDDNQMGYNQMEDYINMSRIERYCKEKDDASIDLNSIETRDPSETTFKDGWGDGIKMDWHLVPKEDQKCHINWRQSINDDGSGMKRLDSFPGTSGGSSGSNASLSGLYSMCKRNKEDMDSKSGEEYSSIIYSSKSASGGSDEIVNRISNGPTQITEKGVDPVFITCLAHITGEDVNGVASKYASVASATGVINPAINILCYSYGKEIILGDSSKKVLRIDKTINAKNNESNGSSSGKRSSSKQDGEKKYHVLDWGKRNDWLWTEMYDGIILQLNALGGSKESLDIFSKLCYLYVEVYPKCKKSRWDGDVFAFPFTTKALQSTDIWYTSPFGWRQSTGSFHRGIDLACNEGTPFFAVADGTVVEAGDGGWAQWAGIAINHSGGYYSRYLHCSSIQVSTGQQVTKGQQIGLVGGTGPSGPNSYPAHLHFEISQGDGASTQSTTDPLDQYPEFKSSVSLDTQIPAQ